MSPNNDGLPGAIFENAPPVNLREFSRLCAVEERHIVEFVHEGVLHVIAIEASEWQFDAGALRRARVALRLQRDLELNLPGVALALDLMEQVAQLRRELQTRK